MLIFNNFIIKSSRHLSQRTNKRLPVLTLFTKDPCPLCDIAREDISIYCDQFDMKVVDITSEGNEKWWSQYKYDIPVFHIEGEFLMKHKADIPVLKKALELYNTPE